MRIEQAICVRDASGCHLLARSNGMRDDWLPELERLCVGFGALPTGASCPDAIFVQSFGSRHVAVVQVVDDALNAALRFRLLLVPKTLYAELGGDPFAVAEAFPPLWTDRGELPTLEWSAAPPPRRTVAELRKVLDVPNSATLLGATQALLDGGRVAFERSSPAPELVRSLWALLPTSARIELCPATFAFDNALAFSVAIVPRTNATDFIGYVFEEQAGDYPEGRYELALQIAVEAGDQAEVDFLLSRRSRSQTMRLGLVILVFMLVTPVLIALLERSLRPRPRGARQAPPAHNQAPEKQP